MIDCIVLWLEKIDQCVLQQFTTKSIKTFEKICLINLFFITFGCNLSAAWKRQVFLIKKTNTKRHGESTASVLSACSFCSPVESGCKHRHQNVLRHLKSVLRSFSCQIGQHEKTTLSSISANLRKGFKSDFSCYLRVVSRCFTLTKIADLLNMVTVVSGFTDSVIFCVSLPIMQHTHLHSTIIKEASLRENGHQNHLEEKKGTYLCKQNILIYHTLYNIYICHLGIFKNHSRQKDG